MDHQAKAGNLAAAQPLCERYFYPMVDLAARLLAADWPRYGAADDEEDAALSALDCLCAGLARG